MSGRIFLAVAIGITVLLGIVAYKDDPPESGSSYEHSDDVEPSPEVLGFAAFVIREQGYECPEAKLIYPKGMSALGPVLKVHCGPSDGKNGVYSAFAYRLTDRGSKGWVAEVW